MSHATSSADGLNHVVFAGDKQIAQGDIILINSEKGSWIILSTTSKSICMKDDLLTFFTFIDYISTGFKYLITAVFVFNNYPSMY